jgi:phage terminase large subunit-like protein
LFAATLGDLSTWQVWLTVLCAAFALPLTFEQQQLFAAIAGGRLPPLKTVRELWCIAGRRSGKSRVAALIAVFIALFVKHRVSPGERPMVLVIAGSVDQARTVFGYVKGFLEAAPALQREVAAVRR